MAGTTKKPAARKSTAKRGSAKKATARKSTARKSTARKSTAKKGSAKKASRRKSTARKSSGRKYTIKSKPLAESKIKTWRQFLVTYMINHKDLSMSEAMKKASKPWKAHKTKHGIKTLS